jgi:hypothetical protein
MPARHRQTRTGRADDARAANEEDFFMGYLGKEFVRTEDDKNVPACQIAPAGRNEN